MNPTCNPIPRQGVRNLFCPYYSECLDYVIEMSWDDWDCGDCHNRLIQEDKPEISLADSASIAYYELLSDILEEF